MKKLIRTGTMLLGACLVWAAGAKADGVRVFAASIGDETNRFVAGGESTDAQGNAGTMSPMTSSGSEDRSNVWREAFGTHGETIWTVFHHSEGDGDDDNDNDDNDRAGGSSSNGQG